MTGLAADLERQGFCLVGGVADQSHIQTLRDLFAQPSAASSERGGDVYGARNLLHWPEVQATARLPAVAACISSLLGRDFRTVRGLFFDKTPGANWPVLWHQDLSLAVQARENLPGWSNWSVKRGVMHVQPPPEILAQMVTMRLHLDECAAENGALRVLPGSHRLGLLSRDAIRTLRTQASETITARAGDALFMRPLILHASSAAETPVHRRVLHLEFAPAGLLPAPLAWAEV